MSIDLDGLEVTVDRAIALIDRLRDENRELRTTVAALTRLERLGQDGFTVSVGIGRVATGDLWWSVDAMNSAGESFTKLFAARSFMHAIEIAETEIWRRGWTVQ